MFHASLLVFAWFLSHHLHLRRKVKKLSWQASDNNVCIGKRLMLRVTVVTFFTSESELWASVYRKANVHSDSNNQTCFSVKFMLTFTVWQTDLDGFPDDVFRWWWVGGGGGLDVRNNYPYGMLSMFRSLLIFRVTAGFVWGEKEKVFFFTFYRVLLSMDIVQLDLSCPVHYDYHVIGCMT